MALCVDRHSLTTCRETVPPCGTVSLIPVLQRWVGRVKRPECRRHGTGNFVSAVPTGLRFPYNFVPALKRWAKIFRAYGARFRVHRHQSPNDKNLTLEVPGLAVSAECSIHPIAAAQTSCFQACSALSAPPAPHAALAPVSRSQDFSLRTARRRLRSRRRSQ